MNQIYPNSPGYASGSDTSRDAAAHASKSSTADRTRALELFKSGWRGTDWELAHALEIPYESAQPRRSELTAKGLVQNSGHRSKNSRSGLSATVWEKTNPVAKKPKWQTEHESWRPGNA